LTGIGGPEAWYGPRRGPLTRVGSPGPDTGHQWAAGTRFQEPGEA